jgi:hypothetical protein
MDVHKWCLSLRSPAVNHARFLSFLAAISLTSCSFGPSSGLSRPSSSKLVEMSEWPTFSILSPVKFRDHVTRDDQSVAFATYDSHTSARKPTDFSVFLYSELSSPCIPILTGVSQLSRTLESGGTITWGRVDAWDGFGIEGWEFPYDLHQIICRYDGTPRPNAVFALCAERNHQTVVICISQVERNDSLAKQIFETFRWTK